MLYAGIDPGKTGALALLDADGQVLDLTPMPMIGREYDVATIAGTLHRWRERQTFVCVEKLQPMPRSMGGASANFARGVASAWSWVLIALRVPHHVVPPRTWQKRMHEGTVGWDTKARSIQAAGRLFPSTSLLRTPRSRKLDHGLADALLIAEYGRRINCS
jgi:hypothetical protein